MSYELRISAPSLDRAEAAAALRAIGASGDEQEHLLERGPLVARFAIAEDGIAVALISVGGDATHDDVDGIVSALFRVAERLSGSVLDPQLGRVVTANERRTIIDSFEL